MTKSASSKILAKPWRIAIKQETTLLFHAGFTLLEGVLSLMALVSMLGLGASYIKKEGDKALHQAAAYQLITLAKAANQYAQYHQQQLLSSLKAADTYALKLDSLKTEGYLSNDSPGDAMRNPYGQNYTIHITKTEVANDSLTVLIFTQGGTAIADNRLRQITRLVGPTGGYIAASSPTEMIGNFGSWRLPLPRNGVLTAGHLAVLNTVTIDTIMNVSHLLHRVAVPGHPELNQMETDLQLQAQRIEYDDGAYRGHLSNNQLLFEGAGNQIQIKDGSLRLTSGNQQLTVEDNQLFFSTAKLHSDLVYQSSSQVQAGWNKVPYYEFPGGYSLLKRRNFADQRCAASAHQELGRLFLLGQAGNGDSELMMCGPPSDLNDGYGPINPNEQGRKARAYLMANIGQRYDKRSQLDPDEENLDPGRPIEDASEIGGWLLPPQLQTSATNGGLLVGPQTAEQNMQSALQFLFEGSNDLPSIVDILSNSGDSGLKAAAEKFSDYQEEEQRLAFVEDYNNQRLPEVIKIFFRRLALQDLPEEEQHYLNELFATTVGWTTLNLVPIGHPNFSVTPW